jgi:hypothetical protein
MTGTFQAKMDQLDAIVGHGEVEGKVIVDQVYAKYQHEGLDLKHPAGGGPKYLGGPLLIQHREYYGRIADRLLDAGPIGPMIANVEDLSLQVFENAPIEFGDLRASGHPSVKDGGAMVYDRAPNCHRLTREELRAKGDLRRLGLGNDY